MNEQWKEREIGKCADLLLNFNLRNIEKLHIVEYYKSLIGIN